MDKSIANIDVRKNNKKVNEDSKIIIKAKLKQKLMEKFSHSKESSLQN